MLQLGEMLCGALQCLVVGSGEDQLLTCMALTWQGVGLTADRDIDRTALMRYVQRLIDGRSSQQNLTPAVGLITQFQARRHDGKIVPSAQTTRLASHD